ncbi:ribosome recycling factor domain-containing protein [Scenedesmus sp. NREL 46B-D3]|nr:ribosome recycling factor domain-containing protein [Scenedesmus sp. NREL 46B-D3]
MQAAMPAAYISRTSKTACCSTPSRVLQRITRKAKAWRLLFKCRPYAGVKKSGKHKPVEESEDEDAAAAEAQEPEFDPIPYQRLMEQAVEHLMHELSGVRTGRANPGLIENIPVDASGEHMPVKACGTVTVRNPQLLVVSLYDAGLGAAVVKAIRNSPLSLNPTNEGSEVLVKLPRVTKDTIEKMIKLVAAEAEGAQQSIRRARQKGMEAIKKAFKGASADDKKRTEKEFQKLHDQFVADVERLTKMKDAELREHVS